MNTYEQAIKVHRIPVKGEEYFATRDPFIPNSRLLIVDVVKSTYRLTACTVALGLGECPFESNCLMITYRYEHDGDYERHLCTWKWKWESLMLVVKGGDSERI